MFSVRAGVPSKEDRYVQRVEHQSAAESGQLTATGHSPTREIVELRMSEQ